MIVDEGKEKTANLVKTEFNYIAVGDGGDDTSTSQSTLDNEIYRKVVDSSEVVGNTIVYTASFTGTNLTSNVITELGIFNGASSSAKMLSRVNFNSIGPLASNESVSFTFRVVIP